MILRCTVTPQVLWKREALRVIEDGERHRSRGAWRLATPPALQPGASPLHARHELLDAIIPLARLYIQGGLCPRRRGYSDVPAPALEDEGQIGLGRELQSEPAGAKVGERLLQRFARRP